MDEYGGGGSIEDFSKLQDLGQFGADPTAGDAVFDASQYEFFGNNAVDEIELGGLEDVEDDLAPDELEEEEFQLDKEEGDVLGSLLKIDDLSSTFSKLNKAVTEPTSAGVKDWGSGESSLDQHSFDVESTRENKTWSSQPYSTTCFMERQSLHRTSSYPEHQHPQQQQNLHHHYSSEPILIPQSSFTLYQPSAGRSQQASPNGQSTHPNIPNHPPVALPNLSPFSNSQLQRNALSHGSQFGGNLPQFQNQLVNQSSLYTGNHSALRRNPLPQQSGLVPQQLMPPHYSQQTRMNNTFHPSFELQFQPVSPSPPNFGIPGLPDLRDQRAVSMLRSKQGICYPHHFHESGNQKGGGWPRFKSNYMTVDEIENIHRMQLAATHSNDPYVDDYYHQACLSRKSAGAKLKHHFCPTNLRDSSSKAHPRDEPRPFLDIDALGRVSFSSMRRPRPLLEVDPQYYCGDNSESKHSEKPLEQEPMLAARVIIEDGICLLLDVDDIDRSLQFNQLQDGGAQLRYRRQVLLESFASSLQLVDPLQGKSGQTVDLAPKDDVMFLRIVSLPKGRKLLLRYLELLSPGDELTRVVCMAIFRNLRFLFGNLPADHGASTATRNIAKTVPSCVGGMELKALAACLASVVCSAEHPRLRPIGSPAGDGASVIIESVLVRATKILTDAKCSSSHYRAFWQASFNAFFDILTKYCFNKYDSVAGIGSDVAKAIRKEMPFELLRASLPHINEQQRKILLEFTRRSMPVQVGSMGG